MDPISIGLGAAGLISSIINGRKANDIAEQNSAEQRRLAQEQLHFAKAGSTDALGNRQTFDDNLNQWITQLAPQQQRIAKAGEHEQYLGLTQDAAQNRNIRQRQAVRGRAADEEYNNALAGYKYDKAPSEQSIRDEITNLIAQSRGTGDRAISSLLDRQALRTAGNVPVIRPGNAQLGQSAGQKLADIMLQARSTALNEHNTRDQALQSKYLPAIQAFNGIAGQGGNAPVQQSNIADILRGEADKGSNRIMTAFGNAQAGTEKAAQLQAGTAGKTLPGVGDFSRLISALKDSKSDKNNASGYYGGNPATNNLLSPSTYGNRPRDDLLFGPEGGGFF